MLRAGAGVLRLSEAAFAWLLVVPAVLGIVLVVIFPLAYSLWLSFTDVNLLRAAGPRSRPSGSALPLYRWVGLRNYLQVFDDPLYWSSLWRTLYFVGAFVIEATLVGLGHGPRAQRALPRPPPDAEPPAGARGRSRASWSGCCGSASSTSSSAPSTACSTSAGLIDGSIAFFKDGWSALNVLVSVYMWNQAPFATLLFLAGMQSISEDALHRRRGGRGGLLAALLLRHAARAAADPVPGPGAVHRQRLPDAGPDLHPHDGRPRATTPPPSPGSASRPASRSSSSARAPRSSTP